MSSITRVTCTGCHEDITALNAVTGLPRCVRCLCAVYMAAADERDRMQRARVPLWAGSLNAVVVANDARDAYERALKAQSTVYQCVTCHRKMMLLADMCIVAGQKVSECVQCATDRNQSVSRRA